MNHHHPSDFAAGPQSFPRATPGERPSARFSDRVSRVPRRQSRLNVNRTNQIRLWIYAYFVLLLTEGALRKWLFAGLPLISLPLLIVRDPVALVIFFLALRANLLPKTARTVSWFAIGTFTALGILQLLTNPGLNFLVVLYGLRSYCLHLPLIFVIAEVFGLHDLLRLGRWVLLLACPMAILMVAQFLSPPSSFLNRGIVEGVGQIDAALGRIRPAGTFSFNTGAGSFNLLAAAFLLYSFIDRRWLSPWIRWTAAVALVAVMPVSGSRTFVLSLALLLLFALIGGTSNARLLRVTLLALAFGSAIFVALLFTPFFQEGLETFSTRWIQATSAGGSVNDAIFMRLFGDFFRTFQSLGDTPLLGYGLGLGSNFGAAVSSGMLAFTLAETEWERTVLEMGPIVGVLWLSARCGFGFYLIHSAWRCLRSGRALAWLLFGAQGLAFFTGLTEQPTSLGFLVSTTGLCLAAIKSAERRQSIEGRHAAQGPWRPHPSAARIFTRNRSP